MLRQLGIGPGFRCISKICRPLTGNVDDPGLLFIRNLGISPATRSIIDGILNSTLAVFLEAEKNTVAIQTYFVSNLVDFLAVCFQQKNASKTNAQKR